MHAKDLRAALQTVRRRHRHQRPRPQLRPLLSDVSSESCSSLPRPHLSLCISLRAFPPRCSRIFLPVYLYPPFSRFLSHPALSHPTVANCVDRFDNAVDLTCGTTHLCLGSGGADDLTLGYIDEVLGTTSELGYYKAQYCKKGIDISKEEKFLSGGGGEGRGDEGKNQWRRRRRQRQPPHTHTKK